MNEKPTIAITGAAGNLGSLLAHDLVGDDVNLHLLIHRKPLPQQLDEAENTRVFRVDLAEKATLPDALRGVDTVIHFAGVLFQGRPEQFLPTTNVTYFENLLEAAVLAGVRRVVLVSFPHVEGETSPEQPARGSLEGKPSSMHAITRLQEEKRLLAESRVEPVILRVGMVYGRGILMIDAARFFSRYGLLGVWKQPTMIHLISTEDFLAATKAALLKPEARGIYHLGDEGVQSLQEFLTEATAQWGTWRPWVMPLWMIRMAASGFELCSLLTGCRSPLTRDFITIGQASYYGDTSRMRAELLPTLRYKSFREGLHTL